MRRRNHDLTWRRLHWPQPMEARNAIALLDHLATDTSRGVTVLEARASGGHVHYLIGCAPSEVTRQSAAMRNLVPLLAVETDLAPREPVAVSTRLDFATSQLSLAVDDPRRTNLALLTALAAATGANEELVLQFVIGRGIPPRLNATPDHDPTQSSLDVLIRGNRKPSPTVKKAVEAKSSSLGFVTRVRIGARGTVEHRSRALISGVLAALRLAQAPGTRLSLHAERRNLLDDAILPSRGTTHLTCAEVAGIAAWPIELEEPPGLPSPHPRQLEPAWTTPHGARVFGVTTAPGNSQPLGIAIDDALFHTVLTGPTGTGKSTGMLNLICADLEAGRGVVVIDPKSDLVADVLARIPKHRARDIVVLDPTDERPVGLNPLADNAASRELTADGILAVFRGLFPSMFGPRTSDVLHASLLSLTAIPGATLAWLPRLLTDRAFRARHVAYIDDDALGGFWSNFESLSIAQQSQFIGPVLSRLRQFLLRPSLRRVLDQPVPKFDLARVFTDRKVLLVPLNTGLLGETAVRLLGSLVVTQLWQLTLSRARIDRTRRTPVAVYIDEAQEFLHLDAGVADALARSRALGAAWHLAHQFRDQFDAGTRAAIDANARNKVVFTLGAKDAKSAAIAAPMLVAEDFMRLPQFGIYAQLVRDGHPLPWVSGRTLPAPEPTSDPATILAASQERWGGEPSPLPKSDVDPGGDDTIGRRRRRQE